MDISQYFNIGSYHPYLPYTSIKAVLPKGDAVDFVRPELVEVLPSYQIIYDCLKGEQHLKCLGDRYLPRPSTDKTTDEEERYKRYLQMALFLNVTHRTQSSIVGKLFSKPPTIKLPMELEPMLKNADGTGLSLRQLIEKTLATVFAYGRALLLADYRNMGDPFMSVADAEFVYPHLRLIAPENLINWQIDPISRRVTMIVVQESEDVFTGFAVKKEKRWRHYSIEDGRVVIKVWATVSNRQEVIEEIIPLKSDGSTWDVIPGAIIGATDNDWGVDQPPLYPIASLDLQLYKSYADLNEYAHLIGQPSVFISGLEEGYAAREWKGGLRIGSRNLVPLPPDAAASILQANPQTVTADMATRLQELLRSFGATLYIPGQVGQDQTATGAVYEALQSHAPLISASRNVVDAFTKSLNFASEYVGANVDDIVLELNSDMLDNPMGVAGIPVVVQLRDAGLLTWDETRKQLEINQLTLHDAEEALKIIEEERQANQPDPVPAPDEEEEPSEPAETPTDDEEAVSVEPEEGQRSRIA